MINLCKTRLYYYINYIRLKQFNFLKEDYVSQHQRNGKMNNALNLKSNYEKKNITKALVG